MNSIRSKTLLISIILYLGSAAFSYAIFTQILPSSDIISAPVPAPKVSKDGVSFDDKLPKTEECPLNGSMYSKQQRQWWEKHRPLGVMIENHQEARPQSGISKADVVYEAIAEGGITRFLVIFYCQDGSTLGPVRSARTYFLDFISEYGDYPLYAHVGGANTSGPADALSQVEEYGWQAYNDLNQFSIGFPTFWRDYERLEHEVATEHTMYSTTSKLWDYAAKKRDLTNVDKDGNSWDENFTPYTFKDDEKEANLPATQKVEFSFWDGYNDYVVRWDYDLKTNSYLRSNGGVKHTDKNNQKQLFARNVVVLFMNERNANDGYEDNAHLLYGTKGTGNAIVFMDGKKITASWSKKNRESRTIIKDTTGQQIKFNRGLIWFEILPIDTDVTAK